VTFRSKGSIWFPARVCSRLNLVDVVILWLVSSSSSLGFRIRLAVLLPVVWVLAFALRADQPKLVVAIVVDQLRYDYLERFQDHFSSNGFKLLTDRGAFLTFAHYNYSPTVTGPGHASFLSGSTPSSHGIIGNDWFNRQTRKSVYCVEDQSVEGVGTAPSNGRMSPRNFIGSNFADELRLRFHSKVVGISMKDRGAILPAGRKPAGAYWFESASGNFITSSYYRTNLPAWVVSFNERKRASAFIGQTWDRLIDSKFYTDPDDAAGESLLPGEKTPTFPHVVAAGGREGYGIIISSPFGNQLLAEFARAAIEGEHLGESGVPDLLCVSFSSIDYIGHAFGPYSQEVQDAMLRLDRQLNEFFEYLGHRFGLANIVVVLSADHGVAPTAEFAAEKGLEGSRLNQTLLMAELAGKLDSKFGKGSYFLSPRLFDGNIYLNLETLADKKISVNEVSASIREWVLATGQYQAVFTRDQLLEGRAPGLIGQMALNGYNPERSGDLVLVAKPFHIPGDSKSGTTHGSPYNYDTHVPVLFFGSPFIPGRYPDEFSISDIAPTLSVAFHLEEPSNSSGRPLGRILKHP
jgi:predicted AlkP superfamily pyrophosphatase or phosphodiesterase